jgi:hypothetical protein
MNGNTLAIMLLCGLLGGIVGATAGEPTPKKVAQGGLTAEQQMGYLKSRMQQLGMLTDDRSINHVLTGIPSAKQTAYLGYLIELREFGVIRCHCSRQALIKAGIRDIDISNCISL